MAPRKLCARGRRPPTGRALGLTAALAAALTAAGCTSAGSTATQHGTASPAITAPAARAVFDRYAGSDRYTYSSPTFYLPEAAGYPRFFVASVTRAAHGPKPADGAALVGGATVPEDGPALMLFSQAGKGTSWVLASVSALPAGATVPPLARDSSGYIPIVTPTAAAFLAQPDDVGALQASVVDEGPANPATKVVATGPLTTGMYQGAVNHAAGLTAPPGDIYQWELQGVNDPEFALRTSGGGALVFYTMTLNTTVAVPGYINKANPIRPGPPIQVPPNIRPLLPKDQPTPRVQLSSTQTLSFAAVDPPQAPAKIQVIAIGGGPTSASAS